MDTKTIKAKQVRLPIIDLLPQFRLHLMNLIIQNETKVCCCAPKCWVEKVLKLTTVIHWRWNGYIGPTFWPSDFHKQWRDYIWTSRQSFATSLNRDQVLSKPNIHIMVKIFFTNYFGLKWKVILAFVFYYLFNYEAF